MASNWTHRLDCASTAAEANDTNKTAFANALSSNGSGESTTDEKKMFDTATKLSVSGSLPAQGYGLSVPVKKGMRDGFMAVADNLTNFRYFAVRVSDNTLVLTNSTVVTPPVANWTRADSLQAVNDERVSLGAQPWQVIPEPEGI